MMESVFGLRAPTVSDVLILRDHADTQQFYLLPDHPRIAVDSRTGTPLFNYTLFSRNIEIAYASAAAGQPVESQLGALNMTVDLSVSNEDMKKIRDYLKTLLQSEINRPSGYHTLYGLSTTGTEPKIDYVNTWQQGSVRLDMLEGLGTTFKRNSSQNTLPSLRGTNTAALWATFGSEGAQLLWGMLKKAKPTAATGSTEAAVQANVYYTLEGYARMPALKVSVEAHSDAVYKELRDRVQVMERKDGVTWSYPQISNLTKSLVDSRVIEIHWDDYGLPAGSAGAAVDEIKTKLQELVMGTVITKIVDAFFADAALTGYKDEDLGKTFTHSIPGGGVPGSRLWLKEFKEENKKDISFSLSQTQNYKFTANPQVSVLANLTDQQIEQLVKVVDVGSPEVRVMTVSVYTNADFKNDRIANITTTLTYKQFDTLVNDWIEQSESYVFKTGDETFQFRTRLARDPNGRLLDFYSAKAQINYIGTSQTPAPIDLKDLTTRALTFSYDRLGYVKVDVSSGDIDYTQIKDVYIDFLYDAASSEADAKGSVHLSEKDARGSFTCSKHGRTSNSYTYTVRYVYKSGHEETEKGVKTDTGALVIHDKLVDRLRRTFDVMLDPATVDNLTLKVRYEDGKSAPEETTQTYTTTGSWEYVRPLHEGAPKAIKWRYEVQYKDGELETSDWKTVMPEDDLPTIKVRRYRLGIMLDGEGVDWTKWRSANLEITYEDKKHGFLKVTDVRITKDQSFQTVEVLAFAPDARSYLYRATLVPRDGSEPKQVPADGSQGTKTGVMLLETLGSKTMPAAG